MVAFVYMPRPWFLGVTANAITTFQFRAQSRHFWWLRPGLLVRNGKCKTPNPTPHWIPLAHCLVQSLKILGCQKSDKKWRKMDQAAHISMSTEAETQAVGATRSLRWVRAARSFQSGRRCGILRIELSWCVPDWYKSHPPRVILRP